MLSDFTLIVFVLVDELYKKVASKSIKCRPNIHKAILNDCKVHAVTTSEGAVKLFEITPANIDDQKGLVDFCR